ncbi:YigZ family protein [Schaalia sp. lx-260]|uniref:YigZ family protein n=1 Tax=Schaalia sp. lx-260 TaxID=2899082 RepID=UPI001E65656B|nr:YigZ family protein [Schaalia sp. lx-260]MCD4549420.1 YigZ family protein [Schaalia sp. lx-260]
MDTRGLLTLREGTIIEHEIEIKRSRFIATLARTDTPQEARTIINDVRSTHPAARHVCSAYLIHEQGQSPHQHSSDDGEPAGTAGNPMLEVLRNNDVWNVCAVVTRYFGGILLGTGGLVRAYSSAVSEALIRAPRARLKDMQVYETHLPLGEAGRIEAEIRSLGAHVMNVTWGNDVTLQAAICEPQKQALFECVARVTQGQSAFQLVTTTLVEVDEISASS